MLHSLTLVSEAIGGRSYQDVPVLQQWAHLCSHMITLRNYLRSSDEPAVETAETEFISRSLGALMHVALCQLQAWSEVSQPCQV